MRVDRRNFLRLGILASLAPTIPGWASRLALGKAGALSVGYLDGSLTLLDLRAAAAAICAMQHAPGFAPTILEDLFPLRVVPAGSLPIGNQALANEAVRVGVNGIYPELPRLEREGILGTDLSVLFPDERSGQLHPFYAWSLSLQDGPSPSPPISFRVPIGPEGGLHLRLQVRALPSEVIAEFGLSRKGLMPNGSYQTHFTVDWEANLPRLQRGIYLLGLNPDTFAREVELPGPGAGVPMSLAALVIWVDPIVED